MSWKLDNVQARAKENPGTFKIPSKAERMGLVPGMFAKLIFLQNGSGERMWVEVKDVLGKGKYEGVLANHPVVIEGLEFGTALKFEAKHIADIEDGGAIFHNSPTNYTMNGPFDAFEIWRSTQPGREVTIDESDPWFYAAPEEVKSRSRGRGGFSRPSADRGADRGGDRSSESPKDWSPIRPSRFGARPSSDFNRPREGDAGYEGRGERD